MRHTLRWEIGWAVYDECSLLDRHIQPLFILKGANHKEIDVLIPAILDWLTDNSKISDSVRKMQNEYGEKMKNILD